MIVGDFTAKNRTYRTEKKTTELNYFKNPRYANKSNEFVAK